MLSLAVNEGLLVQQQINKWVLILFEKYLCNELNNFHKNIQWNISWNNSSGALWE